MRFVLTGTMTFPRKEIVEVIERSGHYVDNAVTGRTHYLVHADMYDGRSTTKLRRARQYGVRIIAEDQLFELLEN